LRLFEVRGHQISSVGITATSGCAGPTIWPSSTVRLLTIPATGALTVV